jgi:hypothetical protein
MKTCNKHTDRIASHCLFCYIEKLEKELEEIKEMLAERMFGPEGN